MRTIMNPLIARALAEEYTLPVQLISDLADYAFQRMGTSNRSYKLSDYYCSASDR